eukprot:CAMPEP_0197658258 /NCGR_PEP_ID=MMETSP1338-20131121/45130_1 /TAXON_ID=43686 ORGANISM="Pelagodinium beii, Strain RCC1491" /NCGR_SAMPLE_ID=MMETSP1338 /ASSEMBLY_ACC=CAM_ASM_000754 /LENGTH=181 /DNA_ID=CAMNT_0043234813 /DNA_START=58 /DNA_END=600 /DNA_ORIENTATION=+
MAFRVGLTALLAQSAAALLPEQELGLAADDECVGPESECALNALQRRGMVQAHEFENATETGSQCRSLNDPSNAVCASVVRWADQGGKWDPNAPSWFKDMQSISKVDYKTASLGDWQKLYFCAPPGGKQCGTPPCTCSNPPCDVCFTGGGEKSGCAANPDSIACKPPSTALEYNGMAWEDI